MKRKKRIRIPFRASVKLFADYAGRRLAQQVRVVAFILIYLFFFQFAILNQPLKEGPWIFGGILMVILGLTLFLEGIRLGLMPIGEQVGVGLPAKYKSFFVIALFGFILGAGATFAEPAISALRELGGNVPAWQAPLLYLLLMQHSEHLILAISIGVGVAVIFGLLRFSLALSIKPFIYCIVPVLLLITGYAALDEKLRSIIGLAWDSGAVTTGAVLVPLVLAIGIGVSRASGRSEGPRGGFGIIMLASAFPIISVFAMGAIFAPEAPEPLTQEEFFSQDNRARVLPLFEGKEELRRYAFTRGMEEGRRAFYKDEGSYRRALRSLAVNPADRHALLGGMSLSEWLNTHASKSEYSYVSRLRDRTSGQEVRVELASIVKEKGMNAVQAIIPLSAFLLMVLFFMLRESPRYGDEVVFGIVSAIIGLMLFTTGINFGLKPLGEEVGQELPRTYQSGGREVTRFVIEDFDTDILFASISPEGERKRFFYLESGGKRRVVEFDPEHYNPAKQQYVHIIQKKPLFGPNLTLLGIILVFLFAFGLGYGSTLAEPALNALGQSVEEITIGTVKRVHIIRVVALGVGIGLMMGVARILYEIPTAWMLIGSYLLLIPLTIFSEEDFTGIAWDSGGVTTGPVTVPLVLALGLGLGEELNVSDSFGILAFASVLPILTVLIYGLFTRAHQRDSITTREGNEGNE